MRYVDIDRKEEIRVDVVGVESLPIQGVSGDGVDEGLTNLYGAKIKTSAGENFMRNKVGMAEIRVNEG